MRVTQSASKIPTMFYEPHKRNHGLPYDPFNSLVIPRPIGWITSLSRDGRLNLAPFSHFNVCSSDPPAVMFGPGSKEEGGAKDSRRNAEESGEFVVNMVPYELHARMNLTSAPVDYGCDEAEMAGLEVVPSMKVRTPRLAASPINLECRHHLTVVLPQGTGSSGGAVVIGLIVGVHVSESVITDGVIDIAKLRPVARLGYAEYTVIDRKFRMPRPNAAKVAALNERKRGAEPRTQEDDI